MKVLHVVSGLAPDQRFGGISRVAVDLARRQRARGHLVQILSTDIGFGRSRPSRVEGVPVQLLRSVHLVPTLGFGTIISPGLPIAMLRLLRSADIVHVHVARETNTLLAACIATSFGVPVVLQTHGMLDAPSNRIAVLVDVLLTRRALKGASIALTLTPDEDDEVARLSRGQTPTERFLNGIDLPPSPRKQTLDSRGTVLFLARLHPRKGAVAFAQAVARIAVDRPDLHFVIAGPDEGDGAEVRDVANSAPVGAISVLGPVPHDEVRRLMEAASVFCLPAEHEPFGLTVIEAFAAATPALVHDTAALAGAIVDEHAGWVFGEVGSLECVLRTALANPAELRRRGARARKLAEARFGVDQLVERLERIYRDAGAQVNS